MVDKFFITLTKNIVFGGVGLVKIKKLVLAGVLVLLAGSLLVGVSQQTREDFNFIISNEAGTRVFRSILINPQFFPIPHTF